MAECYGQIHISYKFMSQKLSDSLKGEVRILKKFFLHIGVYGAEIAKEGFSGYVSEVLISYFGSFEKTIKKSQS